MLNAQRIIMAIFLYENENLYLIYFYYNTDFLSLQRAEECLAVTLKSTFSYFLTTLDCLFINFRLAILG
jgi:hypothetical protein